MFQRQSRRAFPVRTILLFTALIAAFLYLLVRNLHRDEAATTPPPTHEQNEEEGGKDLRPAEWFFTVREYPDFKTDVNTYVKAIRQVAQGAVQRGNPGFGAAWTVQGPG
ncbi:MAG: hypothetical protein KDC70_08055, partial [Saprospiraceae bacterium]|nr:hypothetical protein [Saprospiraceae bacterium]